MSEQKTLENIVQELQVVAQQVATLQSQAREIQGTIEYLTSHDVKRPVFQQIGPLLVEIDNVSKLLSELEDTNGHLANHLKNLQERETELRTAYESSTQEFEKS